MRGEECPLHPPLAFRSPFAQWFLERWRQDFEPALLFSTQRGEHGIRSHTGACSSHWAVILKRHYNFPWPSYLNEAVLNLGIASCLILLLLAFAWAHIAGLWEHIAKRLLIFRIRSRKLNCSGQIRQRRKMYLKVPKEMDCQKLSMLWYYILFGVHSLRLGY